IEETHLSYISNRGVPIALFFLKVNLKNPNATIEALTPYNDAEFALQKVRSMINYKNESEADRQVVAASNGDYFHWTGEPDGAVHKNGQIIKELPEKKFFFGIRDDGTAMIGDKRIYDNVKTTLEEAISGRFFLMHYGEIMTDHLKDTSIEPRTTVGVLSPEHVVFMWVDGRRTGHSAGLSLRDMASIYDAIGATDAINLDGGGSTTFVMREKDGSYVPHNKPSDAAGERSVGNGLAVMMKSKILETGSAKKGDAHNSAEEVFLYPSPVEDHVNIFIEKEKNNPELTMTLTNANGFHLMRGEGSLEQINEQVNKQISNLEPGIYIIKVKGKNGTYSSRLMKK
ncbi:MAG: phosphodiester glycosidase family protein, partial [Balneolales bacterium]